jgi:hypothetical protein
MTLRFQGVCGGLSSPQGKESSTTTHFGIPPAESRASKERSASWCPISYPKRASDHSILPLMAFA